MSVTIWEPTRYELDFVTVEVEGQNIPANGSTQSSPYDSDTRVVEITHFTGWKTSHFCDVGEFELTTYEVDPSQVRYGYMLDFDGDFFAIENIEWAKDETGYRLTISGRDFWKYAETMISRRNIGTAYNSGTEYTGAEMCAEIGKFFRDTWKIAGWYRDTARIGSAGNEVTKDLNSGSTFLTDRKGNAWVSDTLSYGAEWRLFCSWFDVGLRFRVAVGNSGKYEIKPIVYEGRDRGVTLSTDNVGVSGFTYSDDRQDIVNAVLAYFTLENARYYVRNIPYKNQNLSTGSSTLDSNYVEIKTNVSNYPNRAIHYSEKLLNLGDLSETLGSAGRSSVQSYVSQICKDAMISADKSLSFSYDNTGMYKYAPYVLNGNYPNGTHFTIGDYITVVDEYLGLSSKQRLVTVKTIYEEEKRYEFTFGYQKITQNDKIKKKFAELNRKSMGR